jgi:hypothetical protein
LIGFGYLDPPLFICLTNNMKELAYMSPNAQVVAMKARALPEEYGP